MTEFYLNYLDGCGNSLKRLRFWTSVTSLQVECTEAWERRWQKEEEEEEKQGWTENRQAEADAHRPKGNEYARAIRNQGLQIL